MRALFYTGDWQGGMTEVVKSLQRGFSDRHVESDIAYHCQSQPVRFESQDGKKQNLANLENLADWLVQEGRRYDIVHAHTGLVEDSTLKHVKERLDSPIVYTAHGIIINEILRNPESVAYARYMSTLPANVRRQKARQDLAIRTHLQEVMFRNAKKIIHLSNSAKEVFEFYYPEQPYANKSVLIPNGSDFYKFAYDQEVGQEARRIKESVQEGRHKIILYSGRLHKAKGPHDLAKAFNRIKKKQPDTSLLFVGEGDREGVLSNIDKAYWRDVGFRGWIPDKKSLAAYYKAADITVIPSYHETFCVSAVESMMMGTPVVVPDVEGPSELFVKPLLAYRCIPGNIDTIVNIVDWVLSDRTRAEKNALVVQGIVSERFNFDKWVNATLELYENVL